jgi:hypothetical protein
MGRPCVTLTVIADLRRRFGCDNWNREPETEITMTEERMALIEMVDKQADGAILCEMLAFAVERIVEAEAEARPGAASHIGQGGRLEVSNLSKCPFGSAPSGQLDRLDRVLR